ncbi:competence protein CoiA [Photobacterium sagamiensis]|uniref:competence protein CoiA family protein n=1 Tax=Photobacterium sagamiensis TaxID=2910241 RepID=UPI003D1112CF
MFQLQHVPFGLRKSDAEFVDVADVTRGKKCDCICPSCHTPLIARQGKEKQWHFAHASRKVEGTDKECDFSFFVSVRMMARQVIENGITLDLPIFESQLEQHAKGRLFRETVVITPQQSITLEKVEKEQKFADTIVDIVGEVKGFSFIIYFTHPNRVLPDSLCNLADDKCGVLEIQLDHTHKLFQGKKTPASSHADKLRNFLQHDLSSKRWVYHPRKTTIEGRAREKLKQTITQYQPVARKPNFSHSKNQSWKTLVPEKVSKPMPEPPKRMVSYQCIICQCQWSAPVPGVPTCPKCHTHFYATEVDKL